MTTDSTRSEQRSAPPLQAAAAGQPAAAPAGNGAASAAPAAAAGAKVRPPPAKALAQIPQSSSRLGLWLVLLACLIAALPPLLFELGNPEAVDEEEIVAVTSSLETWRRWNAPGEQATLLEERLLPTLNDQPLTAAPPGLTWLHMLGLSLRQDNQPPTIEQMLWQVRLTSVIMALVTLVSLYWAGQSLGGWATGSFAALICAANPVFLYYARQATAPMAQLGFLTLAIAAGLWAIRPLRPGPSVERQFVGWVLCGLAIAAGVLTGGLSVAAQFALPLPLMLLICPHRKGHLMGLLAAALIGLLAVLPWAVNAHVHDPEAWRLTFPSDAFQSLVDPGQLGRGLALVLLILLPWTVWVLAAVIQPMSSSSAGSRTRMFLGWLWFLMVLLVVLAQGSAQPAKLLAVIPAGSILIAQLFRQYADLAGEGRFPRFWRILRWPHWVALLLISAAAGVAPYLQRQLLLQGHLSQRILGPMTPMAWVAVALVLLVILGLSLRWMIQEYPIRVLGCWVAWTLVLSLALIAPLSRGPLWRNPVRLDAAKLEIIVRNKPVLYYSSLGLPSAGPDASLLLYSQRTIPVVVPSQLDQLAGEYPVVFLLSRRQPPGRWTRVADLRSIGSNLWRIAPEPPPEAATAPASEIPSSAPAGR